MQPLSRKDFLKLLGASGLGLVFAFTGVDRLVSVTSDPRNARAGETTVGGFRRAYAQSANSWTVGPDATWSGQDIPIIHAAMLPSGKILCIAGSGFHDGHAPNGPYQYALLSNSYAPEAGSLQTMSTDLFCCGITHLFDGTVLLAGGTLFYDSDPANCVTNAYRGELSTYRYYPNNAVSQRMTQVDDMERGRWYPTVLNLKDGKVAIFSGEDDYSDRNKLVEIFDPSSNNWSMKWSPTSVEGSYTAAESCVGPPHTYGSGSTWPGPSLSYYPRMHLMPSGKVVVSGWDTEIWEWDPTTGIWNEIGGYATAREYGASVLLPLQNTTAEKGKILIAGGGPANSPINIAKILDFSSGSLNLRDPSGSSKNLQYARKFTNQAILPDGKIIIVGGALGQNSGYVHAAELFNPVTESWTTVASANIDRTYHATALLLPDGRVWTASGTPSRGSVFEETEFYNPAYYGDPNRPIITSVTNIGAYSPPTGVQNTITINTPDASRIDAVSLVRLGATTHHSDVNGRLLWLTITGNIGSTVTVGTPKRSSVGETLFSNLAPPGWYMIHILDGNLPSAGTIIQIPGNSAPPADNATPQITITSHSANQVLSGSPNFTIPVFGTTIDNGGGIISTVEVKLSTTSSWTGTGATLNGSSWNRTLTASSSGIVSIQARATDNSGNYTTLSIPIRIVFT